MVLLEDTCRSLWFFVSTLAVLFACFQLAEAGGKTLVLVDNANTKETHSIFFNSLKGRNKLAFEKLIAASLNANQRVKIFVCEDEKGKLVKCIMLKLLLPFNLLVVVCTIHISCICYNKLLKCWSGSQIYCYSPSQRNISLEL